MSARNGLSRFSSSFPICISFLWLSMLGGCDGGSSRQVDDWSYTPGSSPGDMAAASGSPSMQGAPGGMGMSTGGAKDINNFRENIEKGYLPLETDVTYEGLFYDYFFDTGALEPCTQLFCPSYNQLVSVHPLSETRQLYLSVGLNSGMKEEDFSRKKLNLVVVLDISGSMSSPFDSYYYDRFGNRVEEPTSGKTKLQIAAQSIVSMLGHLRAGDRFGMVVFDSTASVAKPLALVEETDMEAIKRHILALQPQDSTNMEDGFKTGTSLFAAVREADPAAYENRIIFLTDAMPNTGDTGQGSLLSMVQQNAAQRLFTTFIGIGIDFQTILIEAITKVRGANYYSVHSEVKFQERMDEEFDFMVTPLVFDLRLQMASEAFAIDGVYGSPEADQATGVLMVVNTLFPSKVEDGQTKGGVILLELARKTEGQGIELSVSYQDRQGKAATSAATAQFDEDSTAAPSTGIRKAALLSRYATLLKEWITFERQHLTANPSLSDWERTSVPLRVSEQYRTAFQKLLPHFTAEKQALGDESLEKEIKILEKLESWLEGR